MFKIENYIAPLILSKVEKFVKNINQHEFQVSLWQGDVMFQNLELKLDVLEEELQLPFTFLSGHINDLKIQIPWTKIASEPIIITINTIELVVKLKDFSSSPPAPKPKLKKKISIDEDGQGGYMASLIAKIINNISVICNNIVLKFIEEDIVISMNIQHLSVHSADHRWRRAFIDVSPTNVLFRKLINIIDFTICLDKRNASGKIEFVQEPILYKCSMELRLYRKHNAMSPAKQATTRIDVQTNSLNLSISSQQFPMLMRLYDLFMALKSGRLQAKYSENQQTQPSNENVEQGDDESWLLWAWNMIPAILPDEQSDQPLDEDNKKIFEFGLFVDDINLVLKAQEFLSDPIIPSTKKAIFKPLLSIHMQEFYNISIISGVRKFNVQCGVGFAEILALDECTCGVFVTDPVLLTAGSREKTGNYLKDSFMDVTAKDNKYDGMWTNYYEKNSEESLLARTPALALDILHSVEVPEDSRSSDVGSDLEFSNLSESYVIRVFGSGYVVTAGAELAHRMEKIVQYYKDCDFLPYVEDDKPLMKSQLSPATADDYDALITEVPMKVVQMKLKNVLVVVKEWEHEKPTKALRKLAKQGSFVGQIQKRSVVLELKIDDTMMELRQPLYRNRLIYTACQLPDNIDNELFDKCFFVLSMTLKNVRVDMKFDSVKRICEALSVSGTMKRILYPHLWTDLKVKENLFEVQMEGFSMMLNPAQLMALMSIVTSIVTRNVDSEVEKDVLRNLENSELVVIQLMAHKMRINVDECANCFIAKATISDLLGLAWKKGTKSLIVNWPDVLNTKGTARPFVKKLRKVEDMLTINVHHSKEIEDLQLLPVVTLKLIEGSINFDPHLREFLSFKVIPDELRPERLLRTISTSTKPAINPSQLPSIHSSSDCDVTICPQNEKEGEREKKDLGEWIERYKNFIVNIEVRTVTFYYTKELMESSKASDSLQALMFKYEGQQLVLKMPNIIFHSVKNKSLSDMISPHFKAELPVNLWGNEKVFTWNLILGSLTAYSMNQRNVFNIIQDFSMNISIADETSSESSEKIFTANLLIETSPLMLSIHTSQVKFIKASVDEVLDFDLINHYKKSQSMKVRAEKVLAVIQESPQNTTEIKEFLGLATGSTTTTKTSHADEKPQKPKSKCSFYVQWVCSKITMVALADELPIEKKFQLEIDEILFSLHQQDFYQLKSKIASISGNLYERCGDNGVWTKNITLGVNVQSDENISDNANRFLDVTITKAETANVHTRWNIGHKRNRLYNDDITEINVVMQPLDIIANLDELIHFMPIMSAVRAKTNEDGIPSQPKTGSELPLIHVVCSGFRIFLPCSGDDIGSTDVLIFKINKLHVTPTAVNNLIRNQIFRPDIHSKACALGILDLAGSKIEDRQYQLTVQGVSLSTSNWDGIAALINEKTMIESYDNPAFEWNNLENGPKSPNFKLNTVFKDSTFSFIYAPCIRFKETLIAGTAMEFNCINDMSIEMTLKELALFIKLGDRIQSIVKVFQPPPHQIIEPKNVHNESQSMEILPHFEKRKMFEKKSADDSGVESISQSNRAQERKLWRKKISVGIGAADDVPFEFTFTSSKFKLRCSTEDGEDIVVVLDTPNVFVTHDKYEKSVNLSLYDLFVMYGMEKLFSTRDGVADSSGIKPSLIRVKLSEKMVKSSNCEVQIKRPMSIEFSHEMLVKIFQLLDLLEGNAIIKRKKNSTIVVPVNKKARKFDKIKSLLNETKTFSLTTNQIMMNVKSQEYDFKIALSEFKCKLKSFDRPEKIETSCEVSQLLLMNRSKMICHPLSFQAKLKVSQEYWKKDPLVHVNLNCNFARLDVGWDVLKELQVCGKMFEDVLVHRKDEIKISEDLTKGHQPLLVNLPSKTFTNNLQSSIEHFQDDLRSGAFQFIETSSTRDLPLPYQIQIIDNDIGVICWRYPLPRALHKIKIFPVPFQTANQVSIICKIEFYSQIKSAFEEFCEFSLAENETKLLDLKQNRPSAEVWRIKIPRVILKRDSDDEDEGGDYEFQMHPKVLVACLRIDSYYVSSAIPNLNVFLNVSHVEVNVMNKITSAAKVPEIVENFQLMDDRGKEHEAGKFFANDVKIFAQFFDENYENFEFNATVGAEVVDYGCGNLVPIINDFKFKALVDLHQGDFNFNLMADKIRLKYSPAIGHSLLMTKRIWDQNINNGNEMILQTKFIICNNTASPIGINQSQTNEMICLMPKSFALYHFRTDKLEQSLQFCVCLRGAWSLKTTPIKIQHDGVEFVKLDDHQHFVITVKSITNFQKRISIDGAISIFNMTKETFRLQYKRYDKEIDAPDKSEAMEFDVGAHQSSSVFGVCLADSQQSIRLRLAKSDKKVFSGEIPLREIVVNNKPWLVKVPSLAKCGFTSFWVRIIRETKNEISRVLVMIWPMFVAKSLLPVNATVHEAVHDENHLIIGRGEKRELDMFGTHEDEHELLLKGNYAMLDDEEAKVKLSYKLINRNSFFKIPDAFGDINRAIEKLETQVDEKWPCARDEEFNSYRDVTLNGPTLPVYHLSSQTPEDLSCSLMLTLAPWCSIINSSGSFLKITNLVSQESCSVEANNILMPFYINNSFTISMEIDGNWIQSDAIGINTDIKLKTPNSYSLPIDGHIILNMQTESEIVQLILKSSIENKMRLIVISSLCVVVNMSKFKLKLFSFAADVGEKLEGTFKRNEIPTKKFLKIASDPKSKDQQGVPVTIFADLCIAKGKRRSNVTFSLLLALSCDSDDASFPIKIQPITRKCVNVPSGCGSIPASLSIIKHNEQFFVTINDDSTPFMAIRNDTDFNLFVAQTDLSNPTTKYILPHKEVSDERFSAFQTVPSKRKIFYTPPIINEHFPEITNSDFGLIFACVTGDDFIRWSQPVKIDGTKKIIITVPMFGDVKLNINAQDRTTQITIGYIQNEKDDTMTKAEPSKEFYRAIAQQSFLEVNTNYQKTFSTARKTKTKAFNINFFSKGICMTVYKDGDLKRAEQISLNVDEVGIKFSKLACKLKMSFAKIQVDNELFPNGEYDFPVVLCNKDMPNVRDQILENSIWDLSEILDEQQDRELYNFDLDLYSNGEIENVHVKLQPIRLYIEDTFINILLEIVDDCMPSNLIVKSDVKVPRVQLENGKVLIPIAVVQQSRHFSEPLRLKLVRLEPLHILLSVHTCMRMYIALDHSPLDFSAYEKLNVYTLPIKLGNSMGLHYLSSAIFGAGWVVGSLEILGSPSGLARSLTSGFKDFVSMPVQGLFKGPWGFLVGLTQGSVSLVRNVTTGTVNSVTKLATSVARNLDRLTLDNDHIHLKTDASRRHRPHGLTEGFQQGLTGFGISILGAIGGLARHPLQAKSSFEVFTGVGKGIVGVFAKPISGAAEFVALTGTGMLQSVGYNILPMPIFHNIENHLMQPTADKIISKQLPQYVSSNTTLFTCRGTFSRKNDIKNSFVVLMSHVLVIADLDRDMVIDVIPLERIQPITKAGNADNLFMFKIKDDEGSPTNHEQKYPVSKRTVQYIQQLSGHKISVGERSSEENSEEETGVTKMDVEDVESLSAIGSDKKISFYIDEVTGKYLVSYINLVKSQVQSRNSLFPLFES